MREFLLGRAQRVRVGGQLSEQVRVTSGVPQGSVLGPLLFLMIFGEIFSQVLDIWQMTVKYIGNFSLLIIWKICR
jgi:hypothetical protein